jgi:RND family efflux transporter MFP subunit
MFFAMLPVSIDRTTCFKVNGIFLFCLFASLTAAKAAEFEGFIDPWQKVDAAVPEAGVISMIAVSEGEQIKKDQLLLRLDNQVLGVSLKIAEARKKFTGEKRSAQAIYQMNDQRYKKLKQLKSSGHARNDELSKAKAERLVALANVIIAKDNAVINGLEVEHIKAQIERRSIRSPFDGVVTRIHKELAETVNGTDTTVMTLAQLNPLKLVVHIPTSEAVKLQPGETLQVGLPEQQQNVKAIVDFVSPVTDADSGTVRVKLRIENKDNLLRSGIRAVLKLPQHAEKNIEPVAMKNFPSQ